MCANKGSLDRNRGNFFSPSDVWCLHAPSSNTPEETEFVVDSGASVRLLSRKDFLCSRFGNSESIENPYKSHHGKLRSANSKRQCKSKIWIYS